LSRKTTLLSFFQCIFAVLIRIKPVLFEFPTYRYLRTGDVIGHCTDFGKQLKDEKNS